MEELAVEGDVEIVHEDGSWQYRIQGDGVVSRAYDAQYKAVTAGREEARRRGVELIIGTQDGTVEGQRSHGEDPRSNAG